MDIDTVLVPVDQSSESVVAVEYAVAIAERYDADVHVLSVLDEEQSRALEQGQLDEAAVADEHQRFIQRIWDMENVHDWHLAEEPTPGETGGVSVTHSTVHGFSPSHLLRHPGSAVLDVADDVRADFLVVPRESVEDAQSKVLEKADVYILTHADQPVLSV